MIRAVSFDLGGVLFLEGKSVLCRTLEREGYDSSLVSKFLTSEHARKLRNGIITDEEFLEAAGKELPDEYDVEVIFKQWYDSYELDKDIFDLVRLLRKRGYKTVAFSGNIKSRVEYLDEKYDFRRHFDVEVYSYDYGLGKSDPLFTQKMIKATGFNSGEIVHVDDSERIASIIKNEGVNVIVYSKGEIELLRGALKGYGVEVTG